MKMTDEDAILRLAQLNSEAMAMNDAALADDLDEARFRAHRIFGSALALGLSDIADVAAEVERLLGGVGTTPLPGYGHAMLRLAKILTP
jgi:4-phytase / acid phosphatase